MNKEVLVSIKGFLMTEDEGNDDIEFVAPGEYFKRAGDEFIYYEEYQEDGGKANNLIKISGQTVSIRKRGEMSTDMVFDPERETQTHYVTPFGNIVLNIKTHDCNIVHVRGDAAPEEEEVLMADIDYRLEVNYSYSSDCNVNIKVTNRI
ncbi:MAG: DUF1934 domain-containing protein [Lachnospiraceae bacterium]|nr:DUF1934 domain-containing protein [Candidatus Minthocola equi]